MDPDGLPLIGPGVDLSKVDPIHPKRILAFLNHFISHTVGFLNHFSCVCEEKLENMTIRMQRLETSMNILEAKLSSIPGLDLVVAPAPIQQQSTSTPAQSPAVPANGSAQADVQDMPSTINDQSSFDNNTSMSSNTSSQENVLHNKDDPTYKKYFTMLNMGIPAAAIKQKMSMEGHDPNILDNPNGGSKDSPKAQSSVQKESDSDFGDTDGNSSSDESSSSTNFDD